MTIVSVSAAVAVAILMTGYTQRIPEAAAPSPVESGVEASALMAQRGVAAELAARAFAERDPLLLLVAAQWLREVGWADLDDASGGLTVTPDMLFAEAVTFARARGDRELVRRIERSARTASRGLVSAMGRPGSLAGVIRDLGPGETLRFDLVARGGERALLRIAAPGTSLDVRIVDDDGRPACTIEAAVGQADCGWLPLATTRYSARVSHRGPSPARLVLSSN